MWFARSQELTECYLGSSANAGSIRAQPAFPGFPLNSSAVLRGTGQPAHAGPPRCLCHFDLNHQPSAEFKKQAQDKRDSASLPRPFPRVPRGPAAHLLGASWPLLPFRALDSAPLRVWPSVQVGSHAADAQQLPVCCPLHLAPGCSLVDPVPKG